MTTVPAEGPSAEWFDRSLPRHPLRSERTWRLSVATASLAQLVPARSSYRGIGFRVRRPPIVIADSQHPCRSGRTPWPAFTRRRPEGRRRNREDACLLRRRRRRGRFDAQFVLHFAHAARPASDSLRLKLVLGRRDLPGEPYDTIVRLDADVDQILHAVGSELALDRRRDLCVIELLTDGLIRGDRGADEGHRREQRHEHTQGSLHLHGPPRSAVAKGVPAKQIKLTESCFQRHRS